MASINANGSKGHHKFTLDVTEQSVSTENNTSVVAFSFKISPVITGFDWYSWGSKIKYTVTINGTNYTGAIPNYNGTSTVTLKSGSQTVQHNSDGTKSISFSFSVTDGAKQSYTCGDASESGSLDLTVIEQKATVTSASDFNDTQNPYFEFKNPAGYSIKPFLRFIDKNGDQVAEYVRSSAGQYTSPFSFDITATEWNTILAYLNSQNSYTVRIGCESFDGGTSKGESYLERVFTITDALPSWTAPTYADTNSAIVAITGDATKIVQGKSTVRVSFSSATAKKGATITSYEFSINRETRTAVSGGYVDFGAINSSANVTLTSIATDSRGNKVTFTRTVTMLAYENPFALVNLARINNYEANTRFMVDGIYSPVGGVNEMTIKYRKKKKGGTYESYVTIQDSHEYTIACDNLFEWVFEVYIVDSFSGSFVKEYEIGKGVFPLFIDTKNNRVGINTFPTEDLDVGGKIKMGGYNVIGFVGSHRMSEDPDDITEQGIHRLFYGITLHSHYPPSASDGFVEVVVIQYQGSLDMIFQRLFTLGGAYWRFRAPDGTWASWNAF